MTQDMMTLRALLEKSSDADLLREMIGFTVRAADGTGGRGPDRRRSRRCARRIVSPTATATATGPGRRGDRHGRAEDPEAEEGELLPGLPGAAADGREGAGCGDPGGLHPGRVDPLGSTTWCRPWACRRVSKSQVSRLCGEIDDKVNGFLDRSLESDWPYLWLDATYVKVREAGRIVSVGGDPWLMAVNDQGRREVLGMAIGASEAEAFWTEFLRSLARRGLRGVKLLISDDHKGPEGRRDPDPRRHLAKMPRALRPQPAGPCRPPGPARRLAFVATAFAQEDADSAKAQWRQVADQLRPKVPKLAVLMDEAEHDVLAYMSFPREHRQKLHSTNPIERLHAEVKRRTNVVGIFPNEAAITRLVGAILLEQNDEWAVSRRYMTLESIAPLSDGVPITLPTVAA